MDYESLPQEPEKRRAILVLSRLDLQRLRQESSKDQSVLGLFYNDQVSLLDASATENNPVIAKLKNSGLLNPRTLLIQSPYDSSNYANAVDALYTFAQAKCIHFATLCGFLGTRKISVERMEIQTGNSQTKFSGNLDTSYGGGGVDAEKRAWERMKQVINLEREYDNVKPQLDKARSYISKHQLLSDAHINSFLDLREAGIPIKKEKFSLSITKESQKNLKVGISLNVPMQADLKAQFEQIKKETFDFSLKIEVDFW